jgi:hypothetical protein
MSEGRVGKDKGVFGEVWSGRAEGAGYRTSFEGGWDNSAADEGEV